MKHLYTAHATSAGGRGAGTAKTSDGMLDIKIGTPKELGGKDDGLNPEHLFAAGYSTCYLGAIKFVAGKQTPPVVIAPESSVTAHITLGARDDGAGFAIEAALDVSLPGVDRAVAQDLATKAHVVCPYSWSIRNNIDVKTTVV